MLSLLLAPFPRIMKCTDWIDTDFYMGYSQRLDKDDYLRRLTQDLRKAEAKEKELAARGELLPEELEAEELVRTVEARRGLRRPGPRDSVELQDRDPSSPFDPNSSEADIEKIIPAYKV
jgi:hypothetical protein